MRRSLERGLSKNDRLTTNDNLLVLAPAIQRPVGKKRYGEPKDHLSRGGEVSFSPAQHGLQGKSRARYEILSAWVAGHKHQLGDNISWSLLEADPECGNSVRNLGSNPPMLYLKA